MLATVFLRVVGIGLPTVLAWLAFGLDVKQAEHVYADIENRRRTTRVLHLSPVLIEPVAEIKAAHGSPGH